MNISKIFLFTAILNLYPFIALGQQQAEQTIIQAKKTIAQAMNGADRELFLKAKSVLTPLTSDDRLSALVYYYLGYIDYKLCVVV